MSRQNSLKDKKTTRDMEGKNYRKIILVLMIAFVCAQATLFGISDWLASCVLLITACCVYRIILELRMGSRNALSAYTKEGSALYSFFTQKKTFLQQIFSIVTAIFLSLAFIIVLKGIALSHGFLPMLLIIVIASILIQMVFDSTSVKAEVDKSANPRIANYALTLVTTVTMAFWLNLMLSLAFSAHDLFGFLGSAINFENFLGYAQEKSINSNSSNQYSRVFINLYIILESFKIALANEIMAAFDFNVNEKYQYFYIFYFVVFSLNLVKLFGFSLTFILLQRGVQGAFLPPLLYLGSALTPYITTISRNTRALFSPKKESSEHSLSGKTENEKQ